MGNVDITNRYLNTRVWNSGEKYGPKSNFCHEYGGDHLERGKKALYGKKRNSRRTNCRDRRKTKNDSATKMK